MTNREALCSIAWQLEGIPKSELTHAEIQIVRILGQVDIVVDNPDE